MEDELHVMLYSTVSHIYNDRSMGFTVYIITISDIAHHYSSNSSSDLDFIYNLRDSLTKVPLGLQDTQAATSVIRILASGLLYSTHETRLICNQGFLLCNFLSAIRLLRDLTMEEMHVLAMRRLERSVDHVFIFLMPDLDHLSSHTQTSRIFCRPWEVAIVGLGSMAHPWLEDMVRGPCGIPSLVLVPDILLQMDMDAFPEDYSIAMGDVLRAIRWLAGWGCHIAEIATEHVVAHIVTVLV